MKDRWYLLIFTCIVMALTGIIVSVIERGPGRLNLGSLADWLAALGTTGAVWFAVSQESRRRADEADKDRRRDALAAIDALAAVHDVFFRLRNLDETRAAMPDKGQSIFRSLHVTQILQRPINRLSRIGDQPIADHRIRWRIQSTLSALDLIKLALGTMAKNAPIPAPSWDTCFEGLENEFRRLGSLVVLVAEPSDLENARIKQAVHDAVKKPPHHASPAS